MKDQITIKPGFNGPLGEVTTIQGPQAIDTFRLACMVTALRFYIKTGMKVSRNFSMALVKQTTGLKTSNKALQLVELERMLAEAKSKTNYVKEESPNGKA